MASLPAQVVYAPPPTSLPTGPSFGGHPPPHPNQHPQHSQNTPSNSSAYNHPQHHSQHHSQHLPPPPPHTVHQQQHYQGYAQQYPTQHSSSHHHHAQYQQDRDHPQARRLPSIRDLDFQFQQQQQQQQLQPQQSQQMQQQRQNASVSVPPPPSSANTGPNGNSGAGASTGGSTVSPTTPMISPTRGGNSGGRRYWPPAGPSGTSNPPQGHHQQAPPPLPPHQQNQLYSQAQQPTPASSASSSFTAAPGPGLGGRYTAAQRQGPERVDMGGRASVGSVGSSGSMGGVNAGSTAGGSGGGHGGISSVSPVGRSPLVPQPPYAHSVGYAPPGVIGVGATSGVGPGGGVPGGGANSVGASGSGNGSAGAPGGPQSPYGFPSPHTPHHRLHTPVSQHGHPQHQQHGQGTGGGGPIGSQQHYEYDYGYPAYAHSHGTGQGAGAGAGAGNDHHAYGGRGIPQGMYPPSQQQEPWNAHPHGGHQPSLPYHQNLQQHQVQGYGRPPPPGASSGSTFTGAMGGYGAPPPPPPHAETQGQGQGHVMSPTLPDQGAAAGGGVAPVGGLVVGVAGAGAGGLGGTRNYYFPKIHQLCYMLFEFSRRYANAQAQPAQAELDEMSHNAAELVRLLSEYRRTAVGEGAAPVSEPVAIGSAGLPSPAPEEYGRQRGSGLPSSAGGMRALKRPWEDVAGESDEDGFGPLTQSVPASTGRRKGAALDMADSVSARNSVGGMVGTLGDLGAGEGKGVDRTRSAAEKDMALIRSKRASNSAGASAGAPKGKYRKRSKRATPPGKCHSCNIRETPEWRRGPDGARTLCNACGLHYAKLVRKRDKAASNDNSQARVEIDMDTLRASARAANEREQLKAERERERERERAVAVAAGKVGNNSQLQDSSGAMASPLAATQTTGLGLEVAGAGGGGGNGGPAMNGMGVVAADGWRSYTTEHPSFVHEPPASAVVAAGRPVSS